MTLDLFGPETMARNPAVPTAEDIYQAYNYKVGKIAAIKAITKAMHREHPSHLLERTQAYAAARALWSESDRERFTPHSSTWFNEGRYDDDPETWQRKSTAKNKAGFA